MRYPFLLLLCVTPAPCGGPSSTTDPSAPPPPPPEPPFPTSVATVCRGGVDVHIAGTIHSMPMSARDVEETARIAGPAMSCVMLELCGPRWFRLLDRTARERRRQLAGRGAGGVFEPFVRWFRSSTEEWRRPRSRACAHLGRALLCRKRRRGRPGANPSVPRENSSPRSSRRSPAGRNLPPDVVLGDVAAADTLAGLANSLRLCTYTGRGAGEMIAHARRQFGVLGRAIGLGAGGAALDARLVWGRASTVQDLSVLLFPPLIAFACLEAALGGSGFGFGDPPAQPKITRQLNEILFPVNILLTAWAAAAAPDAIAAALDWRDDALVGSIDAACARGAAAADANGGPRTTADVDRARPNPAVENLFHSTQ